VDWQIEWISLVANHAAQLAHKMQTSLPLFDRLAEEAA